MLLGGAYCGAYIEAAASYLLGENKVSPTGAEASA